MSIVGKTVRVVKDQIRPGPFQVVYNPLTERYYGVVWNSMQRKNADYKLATIISEHFTYAHAYLEVSDHYKYIQHKRLEYYRYR